MPATTLAWRPLNVAIVGGGIGGLAAAVALRREGHACTIYERRSAAGEVGASLSCAANGARWLKAWDVDTAAGKPVTLLKLTMREWQSGDVRAEYDLKGYKSEWGCEYAM
jgi:salicylate hydroxylase